MPAAAATRPGVWGQIRMRLIDWDPVDQEKPSIATANRY
jgi:hypothetical protein